MQLVKSEKAKLELASRTRGLSVRERAALLLADGRKTGDEMRALLQDDGSMLQKLMADGYLVTLPRRPAGAAAYNDADLHTPAPAAMPAISAAPQPPTVPTVPTVPDMAGGGAQAADRFEGKRSLATTRMFLFDICERMFVRRLPEAADQFRDRLREARDRASMMAIAREMIARVEEIAGSERADGLSERIAMLLPPE